MEDELVEVRADLSHGTARVRTRSSSCRETPAVPHRGPLCSVPPAGCVVVRALVGAWLLSDASSFSKVRHFSRLVSVAANCTELVTSPATSKQGGKYGSQILKSRSTARHLHRGTNTPVDQLAEVASTISQEVHLI